MAVFLLWVKNYNILCSLPGTCLPNGGWEEIPITNHPWGDEITHSLLTTSAILCHHCCGGMFFNKQLNSTCILNLVTNLSIIRFVCFSFGVSYLLCPAPQPTSCHYIQLYTVVLFFILSYPVQAPTQGTWRAELCITDILAATALWSITARLAMHDSYCMCQWVQKTYPTIDCSRQL